MKTVTDLENSVPQGQNNFLALNYTSAEWFGNWRNYPLARGTEYELGRSLWLEGGSEIAEIAQKLLTGLEPFERGRRLKEEDSSEQCLSFMIAGKQFRWQGEESKENYLGRKFYSCWLLRQKCPTHRNAELESMREISSVGKDQRSVSSAQANSSGGEYTSLGERRPSLPAS